MGWVNAIIQGVLTGGLYALFACGLSLMFGVMKVVNLAHGDLAVVAGYVAVGVITVTHIPVLWSFVIVVPIMAVFGAALAVIVRRAAWIFSGFGLWFIVVEGLVGQMKLPLPISSFLDATKSKPDPFSLMIFGFWTLAALAVAVPLLGRDLNSD